MENLKQAHEETLKPKSAEDIVNTLDLSLSIKSIADNNERKTLLSALRAYGVNHETLNISPSKFGKYNKLQLAEALKNHVNKPEQEQESVSGEDNNDVDFMQDIIELQSLITEAMQSEGKNRYKKLDTAIGQKMISGLAQSGVIKSEGVSSASFSKILLTLGSIYFMARMVGFSNIANKVTDFKNKILNKKTQKKSVEDEK